MPLSPWWRKKVLANARRNIVERGGRPRSNVARLRRIANTARYFTNTQTGMFNRRPANASPRLGVLSGGKWSIGPRMPLVARPAPFRPFVPNRLKPFPNAPNVLIRQRHLGRRGY